MSVTLVTEESDFYHVSNLELLFYIVVIYIMVKHLFCIIY